MIRCVVIDKFERSKMGQSFQFLKRLELLFTAMQRPGCPGSRCPKDGIWSQERLDITRKRATSGSLQRTIRTQVEVFGLSGQTTENRREIVGRLHVQLKILSDRISNW